MLHYWSDAHWRGRVLGWRFAQSVPATCLPNRTAEMGRQRKSRGLAEKAATTVSPSPDCGGALPQRPAVPGAQGAWADRGLEIRENGGPVGGAGSLPRTGLSFVSLLNRENTGNFLEYGQFRRDWARINSSFQHVSREFPKNRNREFCSWSRELFSRIREFVFSPKPARPQNRQHMNRQSVHRTQCHGDTRENREGIYSSKSRMV